MSTKNHVDKAANMSLNNKLNLKFDDHSMKCLFLNRYHDFIGSLPNGFLSTDTKTNILKKLNAFLLVKYHLFKLN